MLVTEFAMDIPHAIPARQNICALCLHRRGHQCALDAMQVVAKVTNPAARCLAGLWPSERPAVTTSVKRDTGPIRVAFITPILKSGGAERWMLSLGEHIPRLSRESGRPLQFVATVVTSDSEICPEIRGEMSRLMRVMTATEARSDAGRRVLETVDVFVTWGIGNLAPWVLPFPGAQVVWVSHGACDWTLSHVVKCRDVVTHWAGVSEISRRVFPDDIRQQMTVVENGADISRCVPVFGRAATRAKWGLRNDQRAIGYIGRFSPEKRPEALAEAVACLPDNYVGIMVGGGWQEAKTRGMCQEIAGDRVRFVGHSLHVGDALAAIDLWFNASPSEGFCLSCIEAWLAGTPTISTPVGAIPELEEIHGATLSGTFRIGASGREMAAAIQDWMGHYGDRIQATTTARRIAWAELTAPAMGARWVEYLRGVVGR